MKRILGFILLLGIFSCQNAPKDEIQELKSYDLTNGKGYENNYLLIEPDSIRLIMDTITSIIDFQFETGRKRNNLYISLKNGFHFFKYNLKEEERISTGHINPGHYLIEIKNDKRKVLLNAKITLGSGHIRKIAGKLK